MEKSRRGRAGAAASSRRRSISTGASGPRRRSRPGAIARPTGSSRSRRALPRRPRRRWSARTTRRRDGSRAAWCFFDHNRNAGVRVGVRGGARRARAQRRPRVQGALPPRAVGLEAAPAPARRAAVRRGRRRPAPRPATATCTPRRSTRARAATPRRATATARSARYARVEAEHADHSYADDARIRDGRARRPTPATTRAPRKILAEVPDALPARATCSTRRCGGWRSAPGAPARSTRRSHWLDENLRLVPHEEIWYAEGRTLYWKGRVLEKQGHADDGARLVRARRARVPAVGLRAAGAHAAADDSDAARARRRWSPSCARASTRSRPGRSRRAPLFGEPGFLRAVELARMGQGGDARRELALAGPRDVGRQARDRGGHAARARGEDLLWITAIAARPRRRLERVALASRATA